MMLKADLSVLVDRKLDRCACMGPMVVASECGFYCWTCMAVRSGQNSRRTYFMSLVHV